MHFKKTDIRKIYKTTDGYLGGKDKIKKPRLIIVIEQRDDKAVGVVKLFSKDGKKNNSTISNVEILPNKNRKSITKVSLVGSRLHIGRKNGNNFEPLYTMNFYDTKEKISLVELFNIKSNIQNDTKEHRRLYKSKVKRWKKHFKE